VSENAEDKQAEDGSTLNGNKMDTTNLATLFAPTLMHTFKDNPAAAAAAAAVRPPYVVGVGSALGGNVGSAGSGIGGGGGHSHGSHVASGSEMMMSQSSDHVAALRLLIEKRDILFELPSVELHDVYLYLHDHFPEVLDALLRRRSALAGLEIPEDDEEEIEAAAAATASGTTAGPTTKPEEPRGNSGQYEVRGRRRNRREESEGSEATGGGVAGGQDGGTTPSSSSWFKFRDRSDTQEESSTRWSFKKKDRGGGGGAKGSAPHSNEGAAAAASGKGDSAGDAMRNLRFQVPKRKTSTESKASKKSSTPVSPKGGKDAMPTYGETKGTDTIVYSPASTQLPSNRGTPSSDQFFGSANTSPSYVTSPPQRHSACSSPVTFSPPISPPPLHPVATSTTSSVHVRPRLSVNVSAVASADPSVSASAAAVTAAVEATAADDPKSKFSFRQGHMTAPIVVPTSPTREELEHQPSFKRGLISPPTSPLSPTSSGTTSFLSVTPLSPPLGSKLGGMVKAHTDNLDRYISEMETGSESGSASHPVLKRQQQKYVRRRYTDTRHHTTELPDVRVEVAKEMSVRNPPVHRRKPSITKSPQS